ncbi:MAG TPA: GH3 auxin-responsive promoter family protein, partial [Pseudonocardiaceae bacterium]|nr:GH3 auxin-responsive promoter family protein [Pseudonocardiaceae bacterium]
HGLGQVHDIAAFRRAVPIRSHEEFMPWIERMINGESNVLTADVPVAYFSSSGTTGAEKHIPVTQTYLRDCFLPFYYAAFNSVITHHGEALASESVLNLWQDPASPIARTSGGQPHIGPSQIDYQRFGEQLAVGPGSSAAWNQIPAELAGVDPYERSYVRLRLAAEHDIRLVIGVNPAMVAALPHQLAECWPRLVNELRAGTVGGRRYGVPNPARARHIEELADRAGTLTPAMLWPRIELVVAWKTALASLYLPHVIAAYGAGVELFSAPVASCEGPAAVPLEAGSDAGAPFVTGCLYEFIPAEEELRPDSQTLLLGELEPGREYHIVVTHAGGLYRCAVNDLMQVREPIAGTSRIAYAGRNVTLAASGMRLREAQLIRALGATLDDTGLEIGNATARLGEDAQGITRVELAVDITREPAADAVARMAESFDLRLGEQEPAYRRARIISGIGYPVVLQTRPGAFMREWVRTVSSGQRPARVKDRVFQPNQATWERIVTGARMHAAARQGAA